MTEPTKPQVLTRTLDIEHGELSFDNGRIKIRAMARNGRQVRLRLEIDESVRVDRGDKSPDGYPRG